MKKLIKKGLNTLLQFIKSNILTIIIFASIYVITYVNYNNYKNEPYIVDKNFDNIDLKNYDKLMIVAHPDDETLWGGANLLKDNYLVVCVTCGSDKDRVNEIISVMKETSDKYILLGYPDKTNGKRDNWDTSKENILKDLSDIINLKEWTTIVTHNPEGEYGHIHHKMLNTFVTDLAPNKDNLYYFGKYHSKTTIAEYYNEMTPIEDTYVKRKKQIIGLYKTQLFIQESFSHMFNYEDWVQANEWSEINE